MYQITINAPLEKGWTHEHILEVFRGNFKTLVYICMADEQGSMYHTHIFVVFASRVRFSMAKRYFEVAHIEKCKGSVSDNVNYVKKTGKWENNESKQEKKIEGTFEEYGTQPPDSKGKRSDMSELYQMVIDNMTNAEILAQNQDYILQIDKIDKVRTTILTEKYKETVRLDLEVVYISGATGTGKTRGVLENNGYSNVYRVTDYLHPFDSYTCQPVIAFDEFRSSLRIKEMLLFCDIYPIELPSRYANKYACYNKIFVISNWALEKQYSEVQKDDKETWEAFLRRISKVIIYDKSGNVTEYKSVKDYLEREEFLQVDDSEELPFD
ncbi:replication protein [Lacrimispora sp.]|uniref:replication protein n=1 Tax=Lacrimispora sp. TaxID=2719234 RepID=UPI00286DCEE4|nr:replication protein [Lacrimispora sp.]